MTAFQNANWLANSKKGKKKHLGCEPRAPVWGVVSHAACHHCRMQSLSLCLSLYSGFFINFHPLFSSSNTTSPFYQQRVQTDFSPCYLQHLLLFAISHANHIKFYLIWYLICICLVLTSIKHFFNIFSSLAFFKDNLFTLSIS